MEIAKNIDELATALGVARSTVYRWLPWGLEELFNEEAGGYRVEEVRAWHAEVKKSRRKVLRPSLDDVDLTDDGIDVQGQYRRAKTLLAVLQAKKLQGQLVEVKTVEQNFALRIAELVSSLDAVAHQLSPIVANETNPAECLRILKEAFRKLREHYSREIA